MKRLLLFVSCLLASATTVLAQDSYFQKVYNYFTGSCPSYSGKTFDINKRTGDGLNAVYYNGTSFDNEVLRRTDPEVYFYYNGTSPSVEVNVFQFSVVWSGYLYAPISGEYTFTVLADDGIRLSINGKSFIDEWHEKTASAYTKKAKLEGGQAYEIRIEYYQASKDAQSELYWSYEGQKKQVIPQKYLFTNIEEEQLVLLGPSFLSMKSQKKYAIDTPLDRPLNDSGNAVASNNTPSSKPSNPIVLANNVVPNPRNNAEKKPVVNKVVDINKPTITTKKDTPIIADASTPKPRTSTTQIANTDTNSNESIINNNPIVTGELAILQKSDMETHNQHSLLDNALDKTGYKPTLNIKSRQSGPVVLKNILFDKDRYRLKPSSYDELNALVDTLQKNQKLRVIIAGHTDYAGDPIPNQNLSESRARAVTVYLIRHGIDPKRIQTRGYGGTKPLSRAPLGTEERRKNKRVEYILIEQEAKP
ncbi:MAG: PA14 domain-containing protein [Chitinophagales bacterium]